MSAARPPEATPMEATSFGAMRPTFRLDAYYYGFEATGVLAIDLILSAVACAGKCFHSTSEWGDAVAEPYHDRLRGGSPIDWIQNAANDAAAAMRLAPPAAQPSHYGSIAERAAAGKDAGMWAVPPERQPTCPYIRSSGTGEWATNWCGLNGPSPATEHPQPEAQREAGTAGEA